MSNVVEFPRRSGRSRRKPRLEHVVTYRVRVELTDTAEPLWRRLELASDLFLDDVHVVLQAAFGWTDSHLHRFASGSDYYGRDAEYYLMPFEIEEGEDGPPENTVRLDEVLCDVGDVLFYCYDFGDDWQHVLRLEAIGPHAEGLRAVCIAGEGPSPAEDCGGVASYGLLVPANDPTHPRHAGARAEYAQIHGADVDPAWYAPAPFDHDTVNRALDAAGLDAPPVSDLPPRVAELYAAIRIAPARARLRRLLGGARIDQPVEVDPNIAARMVHRYTWLLDRVGDGIALTGAGYLPPAHVEAAVAELGIGEDWIGKGNREVQTAPVLNLRESAQRAGLLRKQKGKLTVTASGRKLMRDPVALWHHLAERIPPTGRDKCATQAGLLTLITIAAGTDDNAVIADILDAIGWALSDGSPLTGYAAARAAEGTHAVLHSAGAFEPDPANRWRHRPSAGGVLFARAALQSQ